MTAAEVLANDAYGTLAAGASAVSQGTVQSWTMSNSNLPACVSGVGQFRLVDQYAPASGEVVLVTVSTGGTALTVTRGAESTTPAVHAAGAVFALTITAGVLSNLPGGGDGAVSTVFGRAGAVVSATGDYAVGQVTGAAPLASPALTGTPTAPTASALADSTQIATTAYADLAVGVETARAEAAELLKAPLASPALTGTPTAPTPTGTDNTTKLATTQYVTSAVAAEATRAEGAETAKLPLAGGTLTGPLAVGGAFGTTPVTLTDAATVAVNAALTNYFRVTPGGNRTLGTPSNPTDGQQIIVEVIQPASGGPYTMSYSGAYIFPASCPQPSLSTAANDHDFLSFIYLASLTSWICTGYILEQFGALVTIAQGGSGQTTAQAAITALTGTQTSGYYLRSNGTVAALSQILAADLPAILAADLPAATTSTQGAVQYGSTVATVQPNGAAALGSSGSAADLGHVHPATGQWYPSDNGFLSATDALGIMSTSTAPTAGTVYLVKLPVRAAFTATNIWFVVSTAGSGSSTGSYVGLYSSAGTLLSGSADIGTQLTTSAVAREIALTTPQALTAGTFVWVAIVTNLASTQPTLRAANYGTVLPNVNLTAASYRIATNGTVLTALPSTITPSSNSASVALGFWFGIS